MNSLLHHQAPEISSTTMGRGRREKSSTKCTMGNLAQMAIFITSDQTYVIENGPKKEMRNEEPDPALGDRGYAF
jgi:hypothetical protein